MPSGGSYIRSQTSGKCNNHYASAKTALGRSLSFVGHKLVSIDRSFTPIKPDILISEELLLNDFGIDGSVYTTLGHTEGSVSVILKSGEAFIGDLAVKSFLTIFPVYAEDANEVL